ncbi:MAG: glycosyl transferase family 1 [Omnitrophica bacterium RIFCSPHIGHO2_02_FULL_63_14]|nr:MAG: glycosyl transferase family 1 [Omnitrophica bacterium RIFCSPHIGHO2_02_FULL_63_14]
MKILMMTNTYKPLVGGLETSVQMFADEYRRRGHRVVIVAPVFEDMRPEEDVVRIPAIQNFNGSDFSVQLPIPGVLNEALGDFKPEIVHSHHPYLVGDTALRVAHRHRAPLVFTHHTLYEQNTHYVPGDSEVLKRFVVQLATGYANLADQVFAPSESLKRLLIERGVTGTPIDVVPTGLYLERFAEGDKSGFRRRHGIPEEAFVVGHLGRLAPEKNPEFTARAVARFMKKEPLARFLIVGKGPSAEAIGQIFASEGLPQRVHAVGAADGSELVDAYHAMDVFAFASQSETQGLVLTEAMAAGVPVVAVDACGVRDVVRDGTNGRLLPKEDIALFALALAWMARQDRPGRQELRKAARAAAAGFSMPLMAERALEIYGRLLAGDFIPKEEAEENAWIQAARLLKAQWGLTVNLTKAASGALRGKKNIKKTDSFIYPKRDL